MDPTTMHPTVPALIDIWESAAEAIVDLCTPLTDEQWLAATPCPGWSVADIVAHAIHIEAFVGGEQQPEHSPDWTTLQHAKGPLGQFIETGIDYRRGRPKDAVLAELRSRICVRRAQLDATPIDADVLGISGSLSPLPRVIRTRIFDLWAHEQDARAAVDRSGGWGTLPAVIAFQQMASSLPYVWGKSVGAPIGSVVRLSVTGPDLEAELSAAVGEDGKGTAGDPGADPDVHLTVSWPDYMRLSCGRVDVSDPQFRARMSLKGDPACGALLLGALAITP